MKQEELLEILTDFENETLGIHNKVQEAVNLARNGKWYHSDTKLQGTKQKVLNLCIKIQTLKRVLLDESDSDS